MCKFGSYSLDPKKMKWIFIFFLLLCLANGQLLIGLQPVGFSAVQLVLGNAVSNNPVTPLGNCPVVEIGLQDYIGMSEYDPNLHIYAVGTFTGVVTFVFVDLGCATYTFNFNEGETYTKYKVMAATFWPGKCLLIVLVQDFSFTVPAGSYTVWGIHACDAYAPPQQYGPLANTPPYNLPDINALAFDGNNLYVVGLNKMIVSYGLFTDLLPNNQWPSQIDITRLGYNNGVIYGTASLEPVFSANVATGQTSFSPFPCGDQGSGYRNNVAFDFVNMVAYQNLVNCGSQSELVVINLVNGEVSSVANGPFSLIQGISSI
eukprot:TRINITY_DN8180_c0_g2_i1.p1 TRINITY_DN8180_c0_g2~~TRINITY_DN8180_c0_g2_i1.p1  ORF type:complete len:317 (-),score=63.18 TRINITY_DN8180_c0_g2_i1:56-1006(-)